MKKHFESSSDSSIDESYYSSSESDVSFKRR